jgi:hypothetical protein
MTGYHCVHLERRVFRINQNWSRPSKSGIKTNKSYAPLCDISTINMDEASRGPLLAHFFSNPTVSRGRCRHRTPRMRILTTGFYSSFLKRYGHRSFLVQQWICVMFATMSVWKSCQLPRTVYDFSWKRKRPYRVNKISTKMTLLWN